MSKNRNGRQQTTTQPKETTVSDTTALDTAGTNEGAEDTTKLDNTAPAGDDGQALDQAGEQTGGDGDGENHADTGNDSPATTLATMNTSLGEDSALGNQAPEVAPVAPAAAAAPVADTALTVEDDLKGLGIMAKAMLQTIDDYIVTMRPGRPVDAGTINRQQISLHRALIKIINEVEEGFDQTWAKVLQRFALHNATGAFRETHVFRGIANLTLGPDSRQAFQRLINLCLLTADPQSRHLSVKQIDFKRTLEFDLTDAGRTKLLNFYRV